MTLDPTPRDCRVTGATGFIGRHLVEALLARPGTLQLLVRAGHTTGRASRTAYFAAFS